MNRRFWDRFERQQIDIVRKSTKLKEESKVIQTPPVPLNNIKRTYHF